MSQHRFIIWSVAGALDAGARRRSGTRLSGIDSRVLTYYRDRGRWPARRRDGAGRQMGFIPVLFPSRPTGRPPQPSRSRPLTIAQAPAKPINLRAINILGGLGGQTAPRPPVKGGRRGPRGREEGRSWHTIPNR
jgi:hypothetical protein